MRRNVDALINSVRSAPLSQFASFPSVGRFRAQKQVCGGGGLVLRKAAGCSPSSVGARKGSLFDGGIELNQRPETAVGASEAEDGGRGVQLVLSSRGEVEAGERHRVQAAE